MNNHQESERLADEADLATRLGKHELARELYAQAAHYEEKTLWDLQEFDRPRTKGIIGVSACTLYFRAAMYDKAESVALRVLQYDRLTPLARSQLKEILEDVWNQQYLEESQQNLTLFSAIQVALRGGEVGFGLAPMDLIVDNLDGIQRIFYRIIELAKQLPLRQHGQPSRAVKDLFKASVTQARPGSYRYSIRLYGPEQRSLFQQDNVDPMEISETFMNLVAAINDGRSDTIVEQIPDSQYRDTLVKLVRNVLPTGDQVKEVEFRRLDAGREDVTVLRDAARVNVRRLISRPIDALKESKISGSMQGAERPAEQEEIGTLRGLQLDEKWLEIADSEGKRTRCYIEGALIVDDVVGPMVNKPVIVTGTWENGRDHRFILRDIELVSSARLGNTS